MKRQYLSMLFCTVLLAGCGIDFSTRYDRIEENRVRPIAFVYDNNGFAEAAPGDTVSCAAYFAGEELSSIDWTVATTLIISQFGSDTFADSVSLDRYLLPGSYHEHFGGTTDSVRFAFVVPADIIRSQFPDDMTVAELLPAGVADSLLPEQVRELQPSALIDLVELLGSGGIPLTVPDSPDSAFVSTDSITALLQPLLQAFTVNIKLFATVNGSYRVESTFTVRYNTRLHKQLPDIPVNRNPEVTWIRCYRLTEERIVFDPLTDGDIVDTTFNLFPENETIEIDKGYHYFLVADSGTGALDSAISLTDPSLSRRPEELSFEWFFENEDTGLNRPADSLLLLENQFRGQSVTLLPSLDTRLTDAALWLVVYDSFLGEKLRPVGFSVTTVNASFTYTDAYRKAHGDR